MRKQSRQLPEVLNIMMVLAILLLTACGGGGSTAGGGIGGTGAIASGAVADKGSVHVNGVIYETTGATITLDDVPGIDADIRRGMIVRVDGNLDSGGTTGDADIVTYEDVVEGPLTSFSAPADIMTLTVLGQTVIVEEGATYVDDGTVPAPTPLPRALPDFTGVTHLEVSGFRDASAINGIIRATYIEIKSALTEYEVKGVVENANPPGSPTSFEISGLTITTTGSTVGSIPADGTPVEVKGSLFSTSPDTLVATSIEIRAAGLGETEVEHAEVEGFVDNLIALSETFTLNGQIVDYSGAIYEAGTIDDLADGVKVEVEGPVNGGVLVADKIEFKESIRIEGDASDSDADGSFSIDGLSGPTVFVDPTITEYKGFANVTAGDHVEVRGREISGPGNILATEIRLRSADTKIEFQAPATAFNEAGDTVTMMDSVIIDTADPFIFKNLNDASVTRTVFYNSLAIGDLVKARGGLIAGPTADWQEIELED